jgi:hypothetical protein
MVYQDFKVLRGTLDLMVRRGIRVPRESPGMMEPKDRQVIRGLREAREKQDLREKKDPLDTRDRKVLRGTQDLMAHRVSRDTRDRRVRQVWMVRTVLRDTREQKVHKGIRGTRVRSDTRVMRVMQISHFVSRDYWMQVPIRRPDIISSRMIAHCTIWVPQCPLHSRRCR